MAFIFATVDKWKEETAVFATSRGPALEAVDKAINTYIVARNEDLKKDIRKAWNDWCHANADWKTGPRNKKQALTKLDNWLITIVKPKLSAEDKIAAEEIEKANKNNLKMLLGAAPIKPKLTTSMSIINQIRAAGAKVQDAKVGAKPTPDAGQLQGMLPQFLGNPQSVARLVPFLNIGVATADLAYSVFKFMSTYYAKTKIAEQHSNFAPGDPLEALKAVAKLVDEEIKEHVKGAMSASAGLVSAVLVVADFGFAGMAVNAARSVIEALNSLYLLGAEIEQAQAAQTQIQTGEADFTLLHKYPLLGCYLLTCSTTSAVINVSVARYGDPTFQYDVEEMVKQTRSIQDKARDYIEKSAFTVEVPQNKGIVANKNETTLGIPVGKLKAFQQNVENYINTLGDGSAPKPISQSASPPIPQAAKVTPTPAPASGLPGVKSAWG